MAYYHTCPYCGANLDPGEKCDCGDVETCSLDTVALLLIIALCIAADFLASLSLFWLAFVGAAVLLIAVACHKMANKKVACAARKSHAQATNRKHHKRGPVLIAYHPRAEKSRG